MHDHILPASGLTEAAMFQQAQTGCQECLGLLMERHDGLVQAVVRRQVLGELPFAEAIQSGRIGLWRAILGYNPQQGCAFSTYAWPAISRQVWRSVKSFHAPLVLNDETCLLLPDPAVLSETFVVGQAICELVHRLTPRLRRVIASRYGLEGHLPSTYRQIGAALGLSGERARQLHTEALVWLRHPAHSQSLRSLLGRHTLADYQAAHSLAQRWLQRRGGRHER